MDNDKKQAQGAPSSDTTSALFVSARKKQLEQQEEERRAKEKEEQRLAAEAEVKRLEREVEERRRRAEEEAQRVEAEAAEKLRQAAANAAASAAASAAVQTAQPQVKKEPASGGAKPAAPALIASLTADKKKLAIFGGAAAAVVLIVVVLIIVFSGGKEGGPYSSWIEPLSISSNDYLKLGKSQRQKMVERMDTILLEEEGYSQLEFDTVNEYIESGDFYIDPGYTGSAFLAACDAMGFDGGEYVYGKDSAFDSYYEVVTLSANGFTGIYSTGKLRAVDMLLSILADGGDLKGSYISVKVMSDTFDYLRSAKIDDYSAEGEFFFAVCSVLKLGGEKLYPEYCAEALRLDGESSDDWEDTDYEEGDYGIDYSYLDDAPDGYSTFYDDYSGLKLYYPNTTEAIAGLTGDPAEIVAIRDGGYYLIAFDVTEIYQSLNATDDLITETLMSSVIDSYFANLFGSYEGIVPGSGWNQGPDLNGELGSIALGRFSCDINAATQTVSAYAELTRVDKTNLIVLTMVFRQPKNSAQLELFNDVMSSMQFNAAG